MATNAMSPPATRHHQRRRPVIGRPCGCAGWRGSRRGRPAPGAGARRSSGGRRSGPRGRGRPARATAPRSAPTRSSTPSTNSAVVCQGRRSTPARTACCSKRSQHSTIALRGSPSMASRVRCSSASSDITSVTWAAEPSTSNSTSSARLRRRRRRARPATARRSLRSRRPTRNRTHADGEDLHARRRSPASQPGGSPRFCSRASASGSLGFAVLLLNDGSSGRIRSTWPPETTRSGPIEAAQVTRTSSSPAAPRTATTADVPARAGVVTPGT